VNTGAFAGSIEAQFRFKLLRDRGRRPPLQISQHAHVRFITRPSGRVAFTRKDQHRVQPRFGAATGDALHALPRAFRLRRVLFSFNFSFPSLRCAAFFFFLFRFGASASLLFLLPLLRIFFFYFFRFGLFLFFFFSFALGASSPPRLNAICRRHLPCRFFDVNLVRVPSSGDSHSIVALSVSISARLAGDLVALFFFIATKVPRSLCHELGHFGFQAWDSLKTLKR